MKRILFFVMLFICINVFAAPLLYVVNSLSNDITVIDTAISKVSTEIKCGVPVYRMVIDKDKKFGYATSSTPDNMSHNSCLLKIDLFKKTVIQKIPLEISALANVHLSADGKFAFIVTAGPAGKRNEVRGKLIIVDLNTNKAVSNILLGLNPLDSVISQNGGKIFTADWGSRSVTVIDLLKGKVEDTIPLGNYPPRTLALSTNGKQLYIPLEERNPIPTQQNVNVQNNIAQTQAYIKQEYNLAVIDVNKFDIKKYSIANMTRPISCVVSDKKMYILNVSGTTSKLIEINIPITEPIKQSEYIIPTAVDLAINPENDDLYLIGTPGDKHQEVKVQNNYNAKMNTKNQISDSIADLQQLDKTVSIFDPESGKVVKVIPVGAMPVDGVVK